MRVTPSIKRAFAPSVWWETSRAASNPSRKKNVPSATVSVAKTICSICFEMCA